MYRWNLDAKPVRPDALGPDDALNLFGDCEGNGVHEDVEAMSSLFDEEFMIDNRGNYVSGIGCSIGRDFDTLLTNLSIALRGWVLTVTCEGDIEESFQRVYCDGKSETFTANVTYHCGSLETLDYVRMIERGER